MRVAAPVLAFFMFIGLEAVSAQSSPPTLLGLAPHGGRQGESVHLLVDGTNLGGATRFLFTHPGLSAVIEWNRELKLKPPPPPDPMAVTAHRDPASRNRLQARLQIGSDVPPGVYQLRLLTPLGTTNLMSFQVGVFPEAGETQRNDTLQTAQEITLGLTLEGEISEAADVDHFSFPASAGQDVSLAVTAAALGSLLSPRLQLLDSQGRLLAEDSDTPGFLNHRIGQDGRFIVAVADRLRGGGSDHYYRLQVGRFPFLTGVFPLGVPSGQTSTVKLRGGQLNGTDGRQRLEVSAPASPHKSRLPITLPGAFNTLWLAVGEDPERLERESNDEPAKAESLSWPVTVNGSIDGPEAGLDEDWFRFSARQGQTLVFEIEAGRLGSRLDSVLEIFDAQGQPVPHLRFRSLWATRLQIDSGGMDSKDPFVMIEAWDELGANDYLLIDNEVLQVWDPPRHPDDYIRFKSLLGLRRSSFGTTPEAHAAGAAVYKLSALTLDEQAPPNGLPVVLLHYRNDDGGPGYGRDSRLEFTAPRTGDYWLRVADAAGLAGEDRAYRLNVREPRPDFELVMGDFLTEGQFEQRQRNPANFNIPAGGRIPIAVIARRLDGFEGEIALGVEGLPPGLSTDPAVIAADRDEGVLLVRSDGSHFEPAPLQVTGTALIEGRTFRRQLDLAGTLGLLSPSGGPDIAVKADSRVELRPGGEAELTLQIERRNGFSGRVPVDLRNLPAGVQVEGVGLVGILMQPGENRRTIRLRAEPWVTAQDRPIYVVGRIETNSPVPLEHSSEAVQLRIVPGR